MENQQTTPSFSQCDFRQEKKYPAISLIIFVLIIILAIAGFIIYLIVKKPVLVPSEKAGAEKQAEELQALKGKYNIQPPTQEEVQNQAEELQNQMSSGGAAKSIQEQADELKKLMGK